MTRVYAVSEPIETEDPEYAHGLRMAVSTAIDFSLSALERSESKAPPIPAVLLAQSRLAARAGVSLDTVLRRYLAGYTLLGDFVISEAEEDGRLRGSNLQPLLRAQSALLDRLLEAVSEDYRREEQRQGGNAEQRRADRVKRLLDGELLDTSEFGYEFGNWHLGVVGTGIGADRWLSELAEGFDRRLLLVPHGEKIVWGWLGSRRGFDPVELGGIVSRQQPSGVAMALGEPGQGLAGWRLTHRQAKAALPIAHREPKTPVRYADVALLASMLRDDLLVTSLRKMYLAPLEQERDGGVTARETLRAYFAAECNVSSTAAALGVTRQTITNRLRAVEERFGRSLSTARTELEAVLQLEHLGGSQPA